MSQVWFNPNTCHICAESRKVNNQCEDQGWSMSQQTVKHRPTPALSSRDKAVKKKRKLIFQSTKIHIKTSTPSSRYPDIITASVEPPLVHEFSFSRLNPKSQAGSQSKHTVLRKDSGDECGCITAEYRSLEGGPLQPVAWRGWRRWCCWWWILKMKR